MSVEVRIIENREMDRSDGGDKVLLGMDWWTGNKVVPIWAGQDREGFIGFVVGERKVKCLVRNM